MICLWKYYGLCENLSWHISYAMKLWINDTKQGFDGGLVKFRKRCGFDYREVGKNHVDGGNQGGAFMAPWGKGKTSPKRWYGRCWDSFGSTSGCLHGFGSQGFTLHGVTDSSCAE